MEVARTHHGPQGRQAGYGANPYSLSMFSSGRPRGEYLRGHAAPTGTRGFGTTPRMPHGASPGQLDELLAEQDLDALRAAAEEEETADKEAASA